MRKVAVSNFFQRKKKRDRAHSRQLEVEMKFSSTLNQKNNNKKQTKRRQVLLSIEIK
jgi:hypothetical protein